MAPSPLIGALDAVANIFATRDPERSVDDGRFYVRFLGLDTASNEFTSSSEAWALLRKRIETVFGPHILDWELTSSSSHASASRQQVSRLFSCAVTLEESTSTSSSLNDDDGEQLSKFYGLVALLTIYISAVHDNQTSLWTTLTSTLNNEQQARLQSALQYLLENRRTLTKEQLNGLLQSFSPDHSVSSQAWSTPNRSGMSSRPISLGDSFSYSPSSDAASPASPLLDFLQAQQMHRTIEALRKDLREAEASLDNEKAEADRCRIDADSLRTELDRVRAEAHARAAKGRQPTSGVSDDEHSQLQEKLAAAHKKLAEARDSERYLKNVEAQLEASTARAGELEARCDSQASRLAERDQAATRLENELAEMRVKLVAVSGANEDLTETVGELTRQVGELQSINESNRGRRESPDISLDNPTGILSPQTEPTGDETIGHSIDMHNLREQLAEETARCQEAERLCDQLRQSVARLEAELAGNGEKFVALENELGSVKADRDAKLVGLEQRLAEETERLAVELDRNVATIRNLEGRLETAEQENRAGVASIDAFAAEKADLQKKLAETRNAMEKNVDSFKETEKKMHGDNAALAKTVEELRLKLAKNQEDHSAVKRLLDEKTASNSIHVGQLENALASSKEQLGNAFLQNQKLMGTIDALKVEAEATAIEMDTMTVLGAEKDGRLGQLDADAVKAQKKIAELEGNMHSLKAESEASKKSCDDLNGTVVALKKLLQAEKSTADDMRVEVDKLHGTIDGLKETLVKVCEDRSLLEDNNRSVLADKDAMAARLAKEAARAGDLAETVSTLQAKLVAAKEQVGQLKAENKRLVEEEQATGIDSAKLAERLEALQAEAAALEMELAEETARREDLESAKAASDERADNMAAQYDAEKSKSQRLETRASETEGKLTEAESRIRTLEGSLDAEASKRSGWEAAEVELKRKIDEGSRQLAELTASRKEAEARLAADLASAKRDLESERARADGATAEMEELRWEVDAAKSSSARSDEEWEAKLKSELHAQKDRYAARVNEIAANVQAQYKAKVDEVGALWKAEVQDKNAKIKDAETEVESERRKAAKYERNYELTKAKLEEVIGTFDEFRETSEAERANSAAEIQRLAVDKERVEAENRAVQSEVRSLRVQNDAADAKIRELQKASGRAGSGSIVGARSASQLPLPSSGRSNLSVPTAAAAAAAGKRQQLSAQASSNSELSSQASVDEGGFKMPTLRNTPGRTRQGRTQSEAALMRRPPHGSGSLFKADDEEGEVFSNSYLADLKEGRCSLGVGNSSSRISELSRRNTMQPAHLKSTYPAETQFHAEDEFNDDDLRLGRLKQDVSDVQNLASATANLSVDSPAMNTRRSSMRLSAQQKRFDDISAEKESSIPPAFAKIERTTTTPTRVLRDRGTKRPSPGKNDASSVTSAVVKKAKLSYSRPGPPTPARRQSRQGANSSLNASNASNASVLTSGSNATPARADKTPLLDSTNKSNKSLRSMKTPMSVKKLMTRAFRPRTVKYNVKKGGGPGTPLK